MAMTYEEFKWALRQAAAEEFVQIPPEEACGDHRFSPDFLMKMEKLFRKTKRSYWHWVNTTAKRATVAAAAVLVLCCAALSVKAIRQPILRFFTQSRPSYTEVTLQGSRIIIEKAYPFAAVPAGYQVTNTFSSPLLVQTTAENSDGHQLILTQSSSKNFSIALDTRHGTLSYSAVDETSVILHRMPGKLYVMWEYDEYVFTLLHTGMLESDDLLQLIRDNRLHDSEKRAAAK